MFVGTDLSECRSGWSQVVKKPPAGQLQELVQQMTGTKLIGSLAVRHLN